MALGSTQKWIPGILFPVGGMLEWLVCRAANLNTFICRLSRNLGAPTSWNPQGLCRPVLGLLYLHLLGSRQYVYFFFKFVLTPTFWHVSHANWVTKFIHSFHFYWDLHSGFSHGERKLYCVVNWWEKTFKVRKK